MQGISQDNSELNQTVIGNMLARNARNYWYRPKYCVNDKKIRSYDGDILQRLLEMTHSSRSRDNEAIVNEAVAAQSGYVCPSYDRIPHLWKGCDEVKKPEYVWKNAFEVRQAAQLTGFVCADPLENKLICNYNARFRRNSVRFNVLPSVDGERSGPDENFQISAKLIWNSKDGVEIEIIEEKT